MSISYTATSLAEIVDQFERRKESCARSAVNTKSKREMEAYRSAALAWAEAADILRNITITPSETPHAK